MGEEGPLTTYLGFDIKVDRQNRSVYLCMKKFVEKFYERFNLVVKQSVVVPISEAWTSPRKCRVSR